MPHTHDTIDLYTEIEICAMGSVIVLLYTVSFSFISYTLFSIIFFKVAFTEYYTAIVET